MENIFVLINQKVFGPYSLEKVRGYLSNKVFSTSTLYSSNGNKWEAIENHPNLFVPLPPPQKNYHQTSYNIVVSYWEIRQIPDSEISRYMLQF